MIKFENTETCGWEHAIRGMRNPKNSWGKSDSGWCDMETYKGDGVYDGIGIVFSVGENDLKLMKTLRKAGTDHRKYLRQIAVYVDITAPLYWWKEFDTYKVGTVANSCSTMHKIADKEFELDDFSHEHFTTRSLEFLMELIVYLNECRNLFINYETDNNSGYPKPTKKEVWWQMIQLLPSSYNQKRTVMLNYEVLNNIYKSRKGHKLDEWSQGFMEWIESLPYAKELIIGEE